MKILILGDSHTRVFAYRKNIYPFFMGPGGQINLSRGVETIRRKATKIVTQFGLKTNDWVFFHLGEPDCRLQLKRGWHPHKLTNVKSIVDKKFLDARIDSYVNILSEMPKNTGIISAVTAYPPVFNAIKYFNNHLKDRTKNFVDIFSHIFDGINIKRKYENADFKHDPLHLNSKVADLFVKKLDILKITRISDHTQTKPGHFDICDVRSDFKTSRFGSYTI